MKVFKLKNYLQRMTFLLMFILVGNVFAMAADIKVTGRVTDEKGELLIGVTVMQKGTTNGVATDVNGSYSLALSPSEQPVVVVSYVGYKTQEIRVNSKKTVLDVVLVEEQTALDEVVIVGYGQQRKVSVLGAQSSMKTEDIKIPAANLSSVLAGRLAGVVAVQRSGEPGHDDSDIWIRGISTFGGNNAKPLILVDGVERDFNNIDPEDIESFTILKDASATAVYGVRGANGVIIIKTKPGKAGKPSFRVDYYEGFTRLAKIPDMADGLTYMEAANEAFAYTNPTSKPRYSAQFIEATKKANGMLANDDPMKYNKYLYPSVNWLDEVFNDWGHNRRANVNVTGGSPNVSYYLSLSYYNEKGLTTTDNDVNYDSKMKFTRYNFTSNLNIKASEKTKIDVGVAGYIADGNYPDQKTTDVFGEAMGMSPVEFAAMYPGGYVPGISSNGGDRNPYSDIAMRGYKNETGNQINSNVRVTQNLDFWDWSEGLSITAMYAFDVNNRQYLRFGREMSTYYINANKDADTGLWIDPYEENGELKLTRTFEKPTSLGFDKKWEMDRNTYVEASMNYDRVFNDVHRVGALVLFNMKVRKTAYDIDDRNLAQLIDALPYKNRGLAGRVTYSYNDRYFAEFNVGYNGSENFSPKNRYGTFPAMGIGWVISNENFWSGISPYVSYLKLRYTYGTVGSDVAGDRRFGYMTLVNTDQGSYQFGSERGELKGVAITEYGSDISWSVAKKQDLGIDLKLFNDELSLTADFFKEHREDIFLHRVSIPEFAGLKSKPWANLGVIENKGVELTMEYRKQLGKELFITARGNFTWNDDKIIENDEPAQIYPWLEKRGSNVMARWGYVAEGLFTSEDEIKNHARQFAESTPGEISRIGDIKYKDLNDDGVIDSYDQMKIGRGDVPQINYGFGIDLQWKNFAFGALFQGTAKADRMLSGSCINPFVGDGGKGNLFANISDRWDPENPENQDVFYPRLAWGGGAAQNTNNFKNSTWWQKDMSFLRLKQLSLSYQLPNRWMEKIAFKSARVYVMGSNVLTFSKFKLWDPELNTNNGTAYPNVATYSIGINFGF